MLVKLPLALMSSSINRCMIRAQHPGTPANIGAVIQMAVESKKCDISLFHETSRSASGGKLIVRIICRLFIKSYERVFYQLFYRSKIFVQPV